MPTKNPSRSLVTPEFRMSYPALVKPKPFMENGRPSGDESYQVEAIFEEADLAKFRIYDEAQNKYVEVNISDVLVQLAKEAWPNESVKAIFEAQGGKGWPLKRGDALKAKLEAKGKKGDHYEGKRVISITANTKVRATKEPLPPPTLSMVTGDKTYRTLDRLVEDDMAKARQVFSGGNYGFATINIAAMTVANVRYLKAYLNSVRYTRAGKPLGGQSEMDRFDGVSGGASDHNPTQGMDDEIPF